MRILWVKAGGIVPADTGGRIRSLHILKELARRHSVYLLRGAFWRSTSRCRSSWGAERIR